jgi:flagellar assembly factor FliW
MLSSQLAQTVDHPDTANDGDAHGADASESAQRLVVTTRFGRIEIDARNVVTLRRPLHGFPNLTRFALLDIPGAAEGRFKLFQALDNRAAGFIVLPMSREAGMIADDDLAQAYAEHGLDPASAAVLLLVTFRKNDAGGTAMTANLRAPVLLDFEARTARQHIFLNADYPMRLPLETAQ